MHVEIVLAALVLVVAGLVAVDFFRRTTAGGHEHAEGPAHDGGREIFPASRAGSASPFVRHEPAGRRADVRLAPAKATAGPEADPPGAGPNWLVRTRLSLLAVVPAAAAALAIAGVFRASGAFQRASAHANVSSMREGAIASAILALAFAAVVLAAGLWSAVYLIRSVLRPLRQLRAGAAELTEVWLPDAIRHLSGDGESRPPAVISAGVPAADEIGQIARAFGQVQEQVLRLVGNEAGLHGRFGEMLTELSGRGQSLMDHQLRLIDELGQGELDTGRRASLVTMNHLATRMRRYSQNLLVLAGQELPGRDQPVTLVNLVRVAATQAVEHERIAVNVQPGLSVAGPAVNDVVHLIAELAENAAALSAANTPVAISGRALASGGVLVEVTDQGVGMNPETMALANWRLEHPPPVDVAVSRNMGLFVVGRLAARHGIRVRLQPAASGGLTAMAWLPDAIVLLPDTSAPSSAPSAPARSAPSAPARSAPALAAPAPALAAPAAVLRPAPVLDDLRPAQPPTPGHAAGSGPRPRHARLASGSRVLLRARPPVSAQPPAQVQPAQAPVPGQDASPPGAPAATAPGTWESPADDPVDQRRLPIYEGVELDWFGNRRQRSGGAGQAVGGWKSQADSGWDAAKTILAPATGGATTAGLPVRVPRANLLPGAIGGSPSGAAAPARSADAARDRLSGFQRGVGRGRAAADGSADSAP